ncbi:MAG: hypothetical protein HOI53_02715 [Francisellaceae bacterium]|nr:hypothetical protein [Francisellaceae bacterium]MBT6206916.1 hypothetical protein [Francisellaceae bacterium]MBT6539166.1 hypothetical protein [Francisellaceae bacterium]
MFAKIIYGLYLISFLVGGTSSIIGVIIAYIHDKSGPDWLDSHYRFQIRTFWIGLCYSLVSLILTPILIGIFGFIFTAIWLIIRCIKGFKLLIREQEHPNVMTWWV